MTRERFELVIESVPHSIPAVTRLRGLLKIALRAFGLRVVTAREINAADATPAGATKQGGD
jgi:hypothetical protein